MNFSLIVLPIVVSFACLSYYLFEIGVTNEYTPIYAEQIYSKNGNRKNQKSLKLGLAGSLKARYMEYRGYFPVETEHSKAKIKAFNLKEEFNKRLPIRSLKGIVNPLSRTSILRRGTPFAIGIFSIFNNDLYNLMKKNFLLL